MITERDPKKNFEGRMAEETGISPKDEAGASQAQQAAESTIQSATRFAVDQFSSHFQKKPETPGQEGIFLVPPFSQEDLARMETTLAEAGLKFREDRYSEHKKHLLAALIFASRIGLNQEEILRALNDYITQEKRRLPHLENSVINYQIASYFVEEYLISKMAEERGLNIPKDFRPTEERKKFMIELASCLNDEERSLLARYIATTPSGYSISPFYSPFSFEINTSEGLRRQNIAVAIDPQPFSQEQIKSFLSQKGISRKESFLVAWANHSLQDAMPFGSFLASNYRVVLQYSPSDRREVGICDALEIQIERSYKEKPIGYEPKGLLPFEELAGIVVVDNLKNLSQENLESSFAKIIPRVLAAEQPLAELEKSFPDIRLFYSKDEIDRLTQNINAIKEATAHPNKIPPGDFWYRAFTIPDNLFGFFLYARDLLLQLIYRTGGESHLQKWREVTKAFAVAKDQDRRGEPLTLILLNDFEIGVSGNDGNPLFKLVRREDGQWYPAPYWDKKSQRNVFSIEGMPYDELQRRIATSPFRYETENDFLREILRRSLNDLTTRVYKQIQSQVDMEILQQAGIYPSHAAIAYREEGPLKDFHYLIGGMTPYGVGIYDSIFSTFVRHLWRYKKLLEKDLSILVPLTGEQVTVRHPLLELKILSFEEIKRRLKETNADVRIPEITIRKSEGYELRAKAWVYDVLLKLKDLGFDAVLGKTMAEKFNQEAARVYVEEALEELGFLPPDYQKEQPLASLLNRQQAIYKKALELGFTVPLEPGYYLAINLSLPLTWKREQELLNFLKEKLSENDFENFLRQIGIEENYFETREIIEGFLDFASGWGWKKFDRSDAFPVYCYRPPKRGDYTFMTTRGGGFLGGNFAISTQAQERFKAAKKTWEEFLGEVQQKASSLRNSQYKQKIDEIINLGNNLVDEISKMSKAEVTEWAEKIIKGEMAAVGRDIQKPIEVKTWSDFYETIRQLMDTARLVLIYRSEEGRFGWEVSTDKDEI